MLFHQYKAALLSAIEQYQTIKGSALSQPRKNDITNLMGIINNPHYTNASMLKSVLETQLYKMKTGFWIFQTGNSQLKKALHNILRAPQHQPEAISRAEVIAAEHQLQSLQSSTKKLEAAIETQHDKILMNKIQLKLQDRELDSAPYFMSYETYCLNVLDKFIGHHPLHAKEAELLTELLKDNTQNSFDPVMRKVITNKIVDACQFAFNTLLRDIDKLIHDDTLNMSTFKITVQYAHLYCHSIKPSAATQSPYLDRQLDKLLRSYCDDGAGKTAVSRLASTYAKSLVLANKEALIIQYGNTAQQNTIAPLCELRQTSRWEDFKNKCVAKSRYITQWLREKTKTPRSFSKSKENKAILVEEKPAEKKVARKLIFAQ